MPVEEFSLKLLVMAFGVMDFASTKLMRSVLFVRVCRLNSSSIHSGLCALAHYPAIFQTFSNLYVMIGQVMVGDDAPIKVSH